ncbi:hypothetical protein RBQ61_17600 [Sedimentibacter sp. MB35-C1]|uniref:hypothetical protein n=1 Tax=Sedimentibacter sp. MB35-C1 TaxID=3070995 RepID=UPI0027E19F24|nr:hypothetical protein [Sedimentibacter sp. MB35-C1]WMJ77352.1 hypothetical protein RBQ61_17600 [Sedimentibacter sp. MB35-C1]
MPWNIWRKNEWFYSTDPTEASASIGGMVSCNASGAKSFGDTVPFQEIMWTAIRVVLANGDVLSHGKREKYCL